MDGGDGDKSDLGEASTTHTDSYNNTKEKKKRRKKS